MFTTADENQITVRGSQIETVQKQIENFKNGFPPIKLEKPAVPGEGIIILENTDHYVQLYQERLGEKTIIKFVPASGAASRMFKSLFAFVDGYNGSEEEYKEFSNGKVYPEVLAFFRQINQFAFYEDLKQSFDHHSESLEEAHLKRKYVAILETLLSEKGLNYGNLPKGLLKFHFYSDDSRTPAEEHLVEGANYARDVNKQVKIHFTVSPEHRSKFEEHIETVKGKYEKVFDVGYQISYSEQRVSTDTIAVDLNNEPFRNDDDSLLFRPAGHGALIENLNDLDADVIFVKNIDNVVPDHLKETTFLYKKALAGVLFETQDKVFDYLTKLDNAWNSDLEKEIVDYTRNTLNMILPENYPSLKDDVRKKLLNEKLDRPVRVCGMVANIGDPGGGPFWARNNDGSVSLQIVETAQIDLNQGDQKSIFDQSTHFNPVDLVCGIKNYKGQKFDLSRYVDAATGFITRKSKDGKELKAQELPGLWNGAMSDWISLMVEVPVITFNPVKQVNDLLKKNHQPA